MPASAIIMAGRPLSQVATPITPRRVGSERISRRKHHGGVVAVGQAVHHAGRALRAAVAGVGAEAGEGDAADALELLGRRLHQQADLPVAGVVAERDRRAVGGADAAGGAENQEFAADPAAAGFQPMPASCDQPNRSPLGASRSNSSVSGRAPAGPAAVVCTSKSADRN